MSIPRVRCCKNRRYRPRGSPSSEAATSGQYPATVARHTACCAATGRPPPHVLARRLPDRLQCHGGRQYRYLCHSRHRRQRAPSDLASRLRCGRRLDADGRHVLFSSYRESANDSAKLYLASSMAGYRARYLCRTPRTACSCRTRSTSPTNRIFSGNWTGSATAAARRRASGSPVCPIPVPQNAGLPVGRTHIRMWRHHIQRQHATCRG